MTKKKNISKLVRDKIPSIILERGQNVTYYPLTDDSDFIQALADKLVEEAQEFHSEKTLEELADVLEVIYALLNVQQISFQTLEQKRLQKQQQKGAYSKRYFLKTIE
jgi:predicted house-cleaning noncanonical NTP pyrophosphatase (MazG superfamily)